MQRTDIHDKNLYTDSCAEGLEPHRAKFTRVSHRCQSSMQRIETEQAIAEYGQVNKYGIVNEN